MDLSFLHEKVELPEEFLRDPSYWMKASEMEEFLQLASSRYFEATGKIEALIEAGHMCHEMRSWGVLDSVLKMMTQPVAILKQPAKFLSYFMSPEPKVKNLKHTDLALSFELDFAAEEIPLTSLFLSAAFESLPCYVGANPARVSWRGQEFFLTWSEEDQDVADYDLKSRGLSAEIVDAVVDSLQVQQREIELKSKELAQKKSTSFESLDFEKVQRHVVTMQAKFLRFRDYFSRAQQLVTLLSGLASNQSAVREVMRRLDWQMILDETPRMARHLTADFDSLLLLIEQLGTEGMSSDAIEVPLMAVVQKALVDLQNHRQSVEPLLRVVGSEDVQVLVNQTALRRFLFELFRLATLLPSREQIFEATIQELAVDAELVLNFQKVQKPEEIPSTEWTQFSEIQLLLAHFPALVGRLGGVGEVKSISQLGWSASIKFPRVPQLNFKGVLHEQNFEDSRSADLR